MEIKQPNPSLPQQATQPQGSQLGGTFHDASSVPGQLDLQVGFNSEQVQKIAQLAVEQVVGTDDVVYQADKVNQWCQSITDIVVIELAKLQKPFKYAVTCIIAENKGTVLHTAATAYWETKKDGLISVQLGSDSFYCIVTIFSSSV